jgi:hypothetical protein
MFGWMLCAERVVDTGFASRVVTRRIGEGRGSKGNIVTIFSMVIGLKLKL